MTLEMNCDDLEETHHQEPFQSLLQLQYSTNRAHYVHCQESIMIKLQADDGFEVKSNGKKCREQEHIMSTVKKVL